MQRDRRLDGLKFRRQVPLGPYVTDFLCHHHRLIVEADGPFHDAEHDESRDAWLKSLGYRVLRFSNAVVADRDKVVEAILRTVSGT